MERRSSSGHNKNAGSDDAANTEKNELPAMQHSSKLILSIARLAEFIDRLCSKNIHVRTWLPYEAPAIRPFIFLTIDGSSNRVSGLRRCLISLSNAQISTSHLVNRRRAPSGRASAYLGRCFEPEQN
jgi:hypothetical protein